MIRYLLSALSCFVFLASAAPGSADAQATLPDIPNYLELTPRIGAGGQPSEAGLAALAATGYSTVINLRSSGELADPAAEERLVKQLQMSYFNIPIEGKPRDEQVVEFLNLMRRLKDEKVFVHCASGGRVGSLMMIHRVANDGLSLEQAEQEAARIGLRSENLLTHSRDVIKRVVRPANQK
jgi:uncharacterized protein (TIGR01244 family)